MTLITSISGIRGTIGGTIGENLTPIDTVRFASAYGTWIKEEHAYKSGRLKVVIGRDARISGKMIAQLTAATLVGLGIDVVDLDLSTTPTVELAVPSEEAQGGIIITASHNPKHWNALKLLNQDGEFISEKQGEHILEIAQKNQFSFADVEHIGQIYSDNSYLTKHIDAILALPLVDKMAIQKADFSVVIDGINSSGYLFVATLLTALGVEKIHGINTMATGDFAHNPEPLPEHLTELSREVVKKQADLGIVVDPDVDRLAFICEDGTPFGEEYTLVAVADYVLKHTPGATVSNLSSTQALRQITEQQQQLYTASAVGEVNVVQKMKETKAVIGGEGNGGIIYPQLHYGRDALVGIALFLSHLARQKTTISQLRGYYPSDVIAKKKIELTPTINIDQLLHALGTKYQTQELDFTDGLKITFDKEWIHLRKSNTEPIIRVYAESSDQTKADQLAQKMIEEIEELILKAQ